MAARLHKAIITDAPAPVRKKAAMRLAKAGDHAAPSPALMWQAELSARWIEGDVAEIDKWSPRRTAAFVVLTCGGFWTCVALGLARLAH